MTARARTIKLDSDTADRLEAWARERGLTVAELLAELAGGQSAPLPEWDSMRNAGRGPWAPEVMAEDARRLASYERTGEGVPWAEVESWIHSWGTTKELPPPKPRKL
jgi:predicted transcriptional regulator